MIAFPDTSFLCAFYRRQDNSPAAAAYFKAMSEALHVSGLLLYEFRQSVRFQVWLHARDKAKGYPQADGDRALTDLQTDLDTGAPRCNAVATWSTSKLRCPPVMVWRLERVSASR